MIKILGPDGIPIEFFTCLFDVLGNDLLLIIEESKVSWKMYAIFNSTFIDLIPKTDSSKSFEGFRPIFLCNSIYKIIAKFILTRVKRVLHEHKYFYE